MRHLHAITFACLLALFVPSFASAKPDHNNRGREQHQNNRGHQNNNRGGTHARPAPAPQNVIYSMSSADFQNLYNNVNATTFTDDKLNVIRQAQRSYYFSSDQVVALMNLFKFDDDRADAACIVADSVVDMEGWYKVDSFFKFSQYHQQVASCSNLNTISQGNTRYSMSSSEFSEFYNTVNNLKFDDDKLSVVRSAAKYNYFTSSQVAMLLSATNFDSERISMGCAMASRVVDPDNWYQAVNTLTFSSSQSSLSQCI